MNLVVRGKQGGRTNKYIHPHAPRAGLESKALCVSRIADWWLLHLRLPRKAFPACSPSPLRIQSGLRHMYSQRPGPHNRAVCARSIVICLFIGVWWIWLIHQCIDKSHSSRQPAITLLLGWFVCVRSLRGYLRVRPWLFLLCVIKPTAVGACSSYPLRKWTD